MCCSKCSVLQRKIWVFGSGVLIGCLALILVLLWPTWGESILEGEFVLEKGSLNYDNWLETPIPMYLEFNMFNWTNPDQVDDPTIKPNLEEFGPYIFREKHKRVNITWNANGTVSFNQTRTWNFDAKLSKGSLDDLITCLNPIPATVRAMVKDGGSIVKKFANFLIKENGGTLTVTKTVREFIFDGYDDPVLTFIKKLNSTAFDIPFDRFGWFVDRNLSATVDGRFTMINGQKDLSKLGFVTEWNGLNQTQFYDGDCANVYGTTGELWPPNIDPVKPITLFITDVCRSVTLPYHRKVESFGIEGSEWMADEKLLDNGHLFEENRCYCPAKNFDQCPPTGVLDVSRCRFGAPAFMSYPHFYMSDPVYGEAVSGMKPNNSLHKFTIALQPKTGIPLYIEARLQLNLQMSHDKDFDIYKNVPDVLMPIFWFTQKAALDEEFASKAKLALLVPNLGLYIAYGLFGLAALIICVGVVLTLTNSWSRRTHDDQEYLNDTSQHM